MVGGRPVRHTAGAVLQEGEGAQGLAGSPETDLDSGLDQEENLDWLLASLGCGIAGSVRGSVDSAELSVVAQVGDLLPCPCLLFRCPVRGAGPRRRRLPFPVSLLVLPHVLHVLKRASGGLPLARASRLPPPPPTSHLIHICRQDVEDLAARLGFDELLGGRGGFSVPKFSADELGRKMAEGASFYTQGTKLLAQDVQYGIKLILKAIVGETLQPREVR